MLSYALLFTAMIATPSAKAERPARPPLAYEDGWQGMQSRERFLHREMRLREAVERGDITQEEADALRRRRDEMLRERMERWRARQEQKQQRQQGAEPPPAPTQVAKPTS